MSALEQLWASTAALYERFGLDAITTPPAKRRRIFMEEATELVEASVIEVEYQFEEYSHGVSREAADVVVTVIGLLQAHGISLEQFTEAVSSVVEKNDAKTLDTHELVNGKITRKAVIREAVR